MSKKKKKHSLFKLRLVRFSLWLVFIAIAIPSTQFLVYRIIDPPFTWLMLERKYLPDPGKKIQTIRHTSLGLEKMGTHIVIAAMAAEDQNFMDHNGFDLIAIEKAIRHNRKHKFKRGASTISQQTAKNAFLWESRSWVRKGLEVPLTLGMETFWGKRRILEVYLNIAELGPGVFGVEAAAQYWFKVPAKRLSRRQAALIAACLPAPRKSNPRNPSDKLSSRADWIEQQMGFMDQTAIKATLDIQQ